MGSGAGGTTVGWDGHSAEAGGRGRTTEAVRPFPTVAGSGPSHTHSDVENLSRANVPLQAALSGAIIRCN